MHGCCIPNLRIQIKADAYFILSIKFPKHACMIMMKLQYFCLYISILLFFFQCYRFEQACRLKWGLSRLSSSLTIWYSSKAFCMLSVQLIVNSIFSAHLQKDNQIKVGLRGGIEYHARILELF